MILKWSKRYFMHTTYIFFIGCLNLWKDYEHFCIWESASHCLLQSDSQTDTVDIWFRVLSQKKTSISFPFFRQNNNNIFEPWIINPKHHARFNITIQYNVFWTLVSCEERELSFEMNKKQSATCSCFRCDSISIFEHVSQSQSDQITYYYWN